MTIGTIAVDLGKTSCRVRVTGVAEATGHGTPGLAERGGVDRALAAITGTLRSILGTELASVHRPLSDDGTLRICVGAAGAAAAPDAAAELARRLSETLHADAAVTSDVVTAHVGALSGRPGTVLVAGTGAVAVSIDAGGTLRRADGWGTWLGDDGGGRWIGQSGLRAALRAHDGRGPATSLVRAATALAGSMEALPAMIGGAPAPDRALAAFAPEVFAAAAVGDPVASRIIDDAAQFLAETTASVGADAPVVLVGGLGDAPGLVERLDRALRRTGTVRVAAEGDPVDGAALLAVRTDLPHERQVSRVRRQTER